MPKVSGPLTKGIVYWLLFAPHFIDMEESIHSNLFIPKYNIFVKEKFLRIAIYWMSFNGTTTDLYSSVNEQWVSLIK